MPTSPALQVPCQSSHLTCSRDFRHGPGARREDAGPVRVWNVDIVTEFGECYGGAELMAALIAIAISRCSQGFASLMRPFTTG